MNIIIMMIRCLNGEVEVKRYLEWEKIRSYIIVRNTRNGTKENRSAGLVYECFPREKNKDAECG